jgi:hypothetical protein
VINRWSSFSTDGTYLGEDGKRYRMYSLICASEAKEVVLDRLDKMHAIVDVSQAFINGNVGIEYCKRVE